MKSMAKEELVEEGIKALYKEFGPAKTIRFFQSIGISKGDTLREIEEKTKRMSKKEALEFVKENK